VSQNGSAREIRAEVTEGWEKTSNWGFSGTAKAKEKWAGKRVGPGQKRPTPGHLTTKLSFEKKKG